MEEEIIVIEPEEETEIIVTEDDVQFIKPQTQEITIEPTFEDIVKTPDENYTGFSKVTVKSIPEEYIIPSGEIDITANGSYDVVEKAVANVNVPEKVLNTKYIDKNGTYNALDDGIDGYSSVEVATSGVDINEYFANTTSGTVASLIKKIPSFEFTGTSMDSFCNGMTALEEFPFIDTSKVTSIYRAFASTNLAEIPPFDFSNVTNANGCFYNFSNNLLEFPSFDLSKATNISQFIYKHTPTTSTKLRKIGKIKVDSATNVGTFLCSNNGSNNYYYDSLTDFEGLENLGKGYSTTQSANYNNYNLKLNACRKLTEQSLINVLNGLYDIASMGCNTQKCTLGSTNLAKLTSEAGQTALANATAKGWTLS